MPRRGRLRRLGVSCDGEHTYPAESSLWLTAGRRPTPETLGVLPDIGRPVRGLTVRGSVPFARARQMNAGAREWDTDWLCFLHADVRMPNEARRDLERAV